jgi:hypothetical protein
VVNRQITRRRQIRTEMSASFYECGWIHLDVKPAIVRHVDLAPNGLLRRPKRYNHGALLVWTNTVTAYLLQQIQLFPHRDRHGLPPWSPTGNRSAKPTF